MESYNDGWAEAGSGPG